MDLITTVTADASAAPDGSATGEGYSGGSADPSTAGAGPGDQTSDQGADQGAGQPSTGSGQADNSADPGTSGGDLVPFHAVFGTYISGWQVASTQQGNAGLGEAADDADHRARNQQTRACIAVQTHSDAHGALSS